MKNKLKLLLIPLMLVALFPIAAFADSAPVNVDFGTVLLALWQAIQNHASTALILVPVFQLLRTNEAVGILSKFSGKYLQVAIAVITALGFVANAWASGQPLGQAAVTGLFTSGGAMLIYEAIRAIQAPADPAAPVAPAAPVTPPSQ